MNENPERNSDSLNQGQSPDQSSSLAPEPQPMPEQMPVEPSAPASTEPQTDNESGSKKKVWPIIAIVVGLIAICFGVAIAVILAAPKNIGAVPSAIEKILSNNTPKNVSIDGVVNIESKDEDSDMTAIKIDFNADLATLYNSNSVSAVATVSLKNGDEFSFNIDEVSIAGGDIFLQLDGISESISQLMPSTTCEVDDELCDDNELAAITSILSLLEKQWIKLPTELISSNMFTFDGEAQCLINAASGLGQHSNILAETYNQNQFIGYTTENINIAAKQDAIYRLTVDEEKIVSFSKSLSNSAFASNFSDCLGDDVEFELDLLDDSIYPETYVEIDGNNNFTRLYLTGALPEQDFNMTIDLSFAYPNTLDITEPEEYTDITSLFQSF